MELTHIKKAGILATVLSLIILCGWELFLRSQAIGISYNDDAPLWANKRSQIYNAQSNATFFIGASRIKFDLDIETWENITGEKAVQLALVGTSPQLILKNLADDEKFAGKLIMDITEMVIYSRDPGDQVNAEKSVDYYKKLTPAQWAGFHINHLLESKFVLLDTKLFSLNALLSHLPFLNRPGVRPDVNFPVGFEPTMFNRQNVMSEKFLSDTGRQIAMKNYWRQFGLLSTATGISGDTLKKVFTDLKINIDKIKTRGGQVLLIRPPSSGEMYEAEQKAYPRAAYWDELLVYTKTSGIHFADYPGMSAFTCPEWSHLTPQDAIVFTKKLVEILQQDKGWSFPNKKNM